MASCAPVGNRRRRQSALFAGRDRRMSNPPQLDNLPHLPGSHAALLVAFCAASMPLASSSAMPDAAVTIRLTPAPG